MTILHILSPDLSAENTHLHFLNTVTDILYNYSLMSLCTPVNIT